MNYLDIANVFNSLDENTELAPEFLAAVNKGVADGKLGLLGNKIYAI